jgi:hypothetical protein
MQGSTGAGSPGALDFMPDGGSVLITTPDVIARRAFVRCYAIHDLVPPGIDPSPPAQPPAPAGRGAFGGLKPPVAEDGFRIASFISGKVAPGTWRDNGGSIGTITSLPGRVVVVQTWENHRQIEALLNKLRHPVPAADLGVGTGPLVWDGRLQQWVSPSPHAAEAALLRELPEVSIENASLDAAVQTLGRLARANIIVDGTSMMTAELDRTHLENAGVDVSRSRARTLHLHHVTLQQALEAVLQEYSDGVWRGGFTVEDGAIVVTNQLSASRLVTRVYDLRDWPYVGDALRRHRRGPAGVAAARERINDLQALIDAIRATVAPESWIDKGGWADIRFVADRLVITQTWQNHEQVRRLMNLLRSDSSRPPGAAPTTGPTTSPSRE